MATNQFQSSCTAITGGTEATITLDYVNYFRLENRTGQILYVIFDWASADAEPSTTNFHVAIDDKGHFKFGRDYPFAPGIRNARVLSAGTGRVSFLGW